jgi:acetyl esterase/lipase
MLTPDLMLTLYSLFNISSHCTQTALLLHLPAYPSEQGTSPASLPDALQGWPVASINYRWGMGNQSYTNKYSSTTPLQWPTPVHDTAFAYAWLTENLAPGGTSRRDIYVFGSYLGASLATSLALTECHSHARFGVRGVATYNGVYNWTMFLPDHPMYRRKRTKRSASLVPEPLALGPHLENFLEEMPALFGHPSNVFDPFASPTLFFHGPGLNVPESFDDYASPLSDIVSSMIGKKSEGEKLVMKPPRRSHLVFPPRISTLKIPQTLLLHDRYDPPTEANKRASSRKRTGNTLKVQAEELAEMMRRSIEKVEFKERIKWDDQIDSWEAEVLQRVQVMELGEERNDLALGEDGQERIRRWLEEVA